MEEGGEADRQVVFRPKKKNIFVLVASSARLLVSPRRLLAERGTETGRETGREAGRETGREAWRETSRRG